MAAAGLYSDLYVDPTLWENFDSPYATISDSLGFSAGAACLDRPTSRMSLVNLSVRVGGIQSLVSRTGIPFKLHPTAASKGFYLLLTF